MYLYVLLQMHAEQLAKVYQPLRSALGTKSKISVAHLLAARQDFSKILRASSGKIREKTACAINKVGLTQRSHNIYLCFLLFIDCCSSVFSLPRLADLPTLGLFLWYDRRPHFCSPPLRHDFQCYDSTTVCKKHTNTHTHTSYSS